MANNYPIMILFSIIGVLFILLAFLNRELLRWIGIKPMSEVFTNPNFQRSARITEKLARLLFAILGIGFLVQGVGTLFLSSKVTSIVSIFISGLSGLTLLAVFSVVLVNWKAK
jgi:hypothetical protein